MKTCSMPFSVCMSVYRNDKPNEVRISISSVLNQTIKPDEVIVVIDGPILQSLSLVLNEFEVKGLIRTIPLTMNAGLGNALRISILAAKNELIARMDSDDIALPDRFEKQLQCFNEDENLSVVGGRITEFMDRPDNVVGVRVCPQSDEEIKLFMKRRCGFNHMTVMFKKSDVVRAGNYQHWHYNEDYYLWLRMMLAGCKFANLSDTLVNVRVGKDMYARRGGWKYFKSEAKLQYYMLKNRIINPFRYLYNLVVRFVLQVLMPTQLRGWVFRKFARDNKIG